jgi:hypothetical protein
MKFYKIDYRPPCKRCQRNGPVAYSPKFFLYSPLTDIFYEEVPPSKLAIYFYPYHFHDMLGVSSSKNEIKDSKKCKIKKEKRKKSASSDI